MRYSSKESVKYDLEQHYKLLRQYREEYTQRSEFEGCLLKVCKKYKGKKYYSIKRQNSKKYAYLGAEDDPVIKQIRSFSYYKKAVSIIESNIMIMEDFLKIYHSTHAENINELLDPIYQLPFSELSLLCDSEVNDWLKAVESKKAQYPIFDPAGLTVRAFDGTMMRSRAECLHYEAFFIYNIPVIFELPYSIDNEVYRPDFTALDVFTMSQKMVEHLGNWFHNNAFKREHYRQDSMHRWDMYATIGYYPETNLLLTFGTCNNEFDAQAIHRKIAMLAVPPPSQETIELLKRS